jgi:hypothetical protein
MSVWCRYDNDKNILICLDHFPSYTFSIGKKSNKKPHRCQTSAKNTKTHPKTCNSSFYALRNVRQTGHVSLRMTFAIFFTPLFFMRIEKHPLDVFWLRLLAAFQKLLFSYSLYEMKR